MIRYVAGHEASFTYFAKIGAHFPYEGYYPREDVQFKPALASASWSDDIERVTNSYDNAVRYACDDFFGYLLPRLEATEKDVLIIYTSDHGEALPGTIKGTRDTHGRVGMPVVTADVPLMILGVGRGKAIVAELARNNSTKNNATHFEIFPTLLRLMGYGRREVSSYYGYSLFDTIPIGRNRKYLAGVITNPTRGRISDFDSVGID